MEAAEEVAAAVAEVDKMKKCYKFKGVTYGGKIRCKSCGMDLGLNPISRSMGLNPIKVRKRNRAIIYCCEDCARGDR